MLGSTADERFWETVRGFGRVFERLEETDFAHPERF
jgi:hypothetical protein